MLDLLPDIVYNTHIELIFLIRGVFSWRVISSFTYKQPDKRARKGTNIKPCNVGTLLARRALLSRQINNSINEELRAWRCVLYPSLI